MMKLAQRENDYVDIMLTNNHNMILERLS